MLQKFSVLMAVYYKDEPEYFRDALKSMLTQTQKANEVVLVENGELTERHYEIIEEYRDSLNIVSYKEPENKGLAVALKKGVEICQYDLIARMDADDLCVPQRFEKQLKLFNDNSKLDLVGGAIEEFLVEEDIIVGKRYVKEDHESILKSAKFYSPVNHVTVMFKKQSVMESGNYQNFQGVEDYPLWVTMLKNGAQFYNIPSTLVKVRVSGLSDRRSGMKYAKVELSVMYYFYKIGFYNVFEFVTFATFRLFLRTIGKKCLSWVYNFTTRKATR